MRAGGGGLGPLILAWGVSTSSRLCGAMNDGSRAEQHGARRRGSPRRALATVAGCLVLASTGCRALTPDPTLPLQHELVERPLVIHSDFRLPPDHPVLDQLVAEREAVAERLRIVVPERPIPVYLFERAEAYHAYIGRRFPEFPSRRAFFVETDDAPAVYAYYGERVAEDLRHEVAHGYLHAAIPNIPLWIDEGLAEYFEVPPGRRGFHASHLARLTTLLDMAAWHPRLERLESIVSVAQMRQRDYAEAWAWVHFFLETTPARRQRLRAYLRDLQTGRPAAPLSQRLGGPVDAVERQLITYVRQLELRGGPPAAR